MTTHEQQAAALFDEHGLMGEGAVFTKKDAIAFAAFCLKKREQTEFKAVAEISERLVFTQNFVSDPHNVLPTDFVMWYSGMSMDKILKAYERFNKEKK